MSIQFWKNQLERSTVSERLGLLSEPKNIEK